MLVIINSSSSSFFRCCAPIYCNNEYSLIYILVIAFRLLFFLEQHLHQVFLVLDPQQLQEGPAQLVKPLACSVEGRVLQGIYHLHLLAGFVGQLDDILYLVDQLLLLGLHVAQLMTVLLAGPVLSVADGVACLVVVAPQVALLRLVAPTVLCLP